MMRQLPIFADGDSTAAFMSIQEHEAKVESLNLFHDQEVLVLRKKIQAMQRARRHIGTAVRSTDSTPSAVRENTFAAEASAYTLAGRAATTPQLRTDSDGANRSTREGNDSKQTGMGRQSSHAVHVLLEEYAISQSVDRPGPRKLSTAERSTMVDAHTQTDSQNVQQLNREGAGRASAVATAVQTEDSGGACVSSEVSDRMHQEGCPAASHELETQTVQVVGRVHPNAGVNAHELVATTPHEQHDRATMLPQEVPATPSLMRVAHEVAAKAAPQATTMAGTPVAGTVGADMRASEGKRGDSDSGAGRGIVGTHHYTTLRSRASVDGLKGTARSAFKVFEDLFRIVDLASRASMSTNACTSPL